MTHILKSVRLGAVTGIICMAAVGFATAFPPSHPLIWFTAIVGFGIGFYLEYTSPTL